MRRLTFARLSRAASVSVPPAQPKQDNSYLAARQAFSAHPVCDAWTVRTHAKISNLLAM